MREVRSSLIALLVVAGGTALACGSDEPTSGDAPDRSENVNAATADGGKGGGKRDGGTGTGSVKSDGGKGSTGPGNAMPINCGKSGFSTGLVVPDMLIVLDRSGSMKPGGDAVTLDCTKTDFLSATACAIAGIDCNNAADKMTTNCGGMATRGPVNRWDPSVNAIESLTAKFDTTVSFGLMTFPAEDRNSCGPGGIKVPVGLGTSGEIKMTLDNMQPGGGTPTGETLQAARNSFSPVVGDTVQPARYVLLVTDGQPTCPQAKGGSNSSPQALEADKQLTLAALDELRNEGIKTFVVGYDAALDPKFATALTEFAQHGGTDNYFPVQNEDSLSAAFDDISKKVATCSFAFKSDIEDPSTIRVTLDGKLLRPDAPDGWKLDDRTIEVQGESCKTLQGDEGHRVEIVVECEPVIYL